MTSEQTERMSEAEIEETRRCMELRGAGITTPIPPVEAYHDDQWCIEASIAINQLRTDLAAMKSRAEKAERKYINLLGSQMHPYTCENRPECDREWTPPKDMRPEQCPFCERGALREQLSVAREAANEAVQMLEDQYDGAPDGGCKEWPGVIRSLISVVNTGVVVPENKTGSKEESQAIADWHHDELTQKGTTDE